MKKALLIIVLFLIGCKSTEQQDNPIVAQQSQRMVPLSTISFSPPQARDKSDALSISKKIIIRNAKIEIVVDNFDTSINSINKFVEEKKGIITKNDIKTDIGNNKEGRIEIKVPAENLDALLAQIKKISQVVTSETISREDYTEEYIDINARLQKKRALENRYREILKTAKNTADILSIEEQLSNVREEIESINFRIKYLDKSAVMSEVSLSINTPSVIKPNNDSILNKIPKGFSDAFALILYLFGYIIIIFIASLFIIPVLYFVYWAVKKIIAKIIQVKK